MRTAPATRPPLAHPDRGRKCEPRRTANSNSPNPSAVDSRQPKTALRPQRDAEADNRAVRIGDYRQGANNRRHPRGANVTTEQAAHETRLTLKKTSSVAKDTPGRVIDSTSSIRLKPANARMPNAKTNISKVPRPAIREVRASHLRRFTYRLFAKASGGRRGKYVSRTFAAGCGEEKQTRQAGQEEESRAPAGRRCADAANDGRDTARNPATTGSRETCRASRPGR